MLLLCEMLLLRQKPSFLLNASSWLVTHLPTRRNSFSAKHFFSSDAPDLEEVELTETLFRRYGFTNTHLSKLHLIIPRIFTPETTLLQARLDFYRGTIGFSNTDLPGFICSNTRLLSYSLQNQIVPVYNFIRDLLLSDDEIVIKTLKRSPRLFGYSLQKRIAPNVAALREAGVPQKQILYLPSCLGESIQRANEMGLDPNKLSFVDAIRMFTKMSKSTWDKKMEVYRKCGMTDAQILKAFRSFPICMALAEENIVKTMDFLVKTIGWQPVDLALNPAVLGRSLEKRIIPRCTFIKYLQGKGLVKKSISLGSFLLLKEKDFIAKFVKKYEEDVPDLMDIYLGKISPPQEPIP